METGIFYSIRYNHFMDANFRKLIAYGIAGLFVYWIFTRFNIVVGPLVIGVLIAFLLDPLVTLSKQKLKLTHKVSVNIVFVLFLVLVVISVWTLTPLVIQQSKLLQNEFTQVTNEVRALQPDIERLLDFSVPVDEIITDIETEILLFTQSDRLFRVILSATSNFVWVLVIIISAYFLLKDWKKISDWLVGLFPERRMKEAQTVLTEIRTIWDAYLRGQLFMMFVIGVLSGVGGLLVGLRGAIIIGLLAGGLALIPSLGPAIATIIAGLIAWTQGSSYLGISNFWFMLLVMAIFIGIQFAEGIWLYPCIMGKRMNLHPAVVFIAVVSTLSVFGALYGLIIVPIIGSVVVSDQASVEMAELR